MTLRHVSPVYDAHSRLLVTTGPMHDEAIRAFSTASACRAIVRFMKIAVFHIS